MGKETEPKLATGPKRWLIEGLLRFEQYLVKPPKPVEKSRPVPVPAHVPARFRRGRRAAIAAFATMGVTGVAGIALYETALKRTKQPEKAPHSPLQKPIVSPGPEEKSPDQITLPFGEAHMYRNGIIANFTPGLSLKINVQALEEVVLHPQTGLRLPRGLENRAVTTVFLPYFEGSPEEQEIRDRFETQYLPSLHARYVPAGIRAGYLADIPVYDIVRPVMFNQPGDTPPSYIALGIEFSLAWAKKVKEALWKLQPGSLPENRLLTPFAQQFVMTRQPIQVLAVSNEIVQRSVR